MALEVGSVVEGKVTGIMKFGAFVSLGEGKSGLVHISEIANTYVTDVSEHLSVGQSVKVKILSISEDGKINLSVKKASELPPKAENAGRRSFAARDNKPSDEPAAQKAPVSGQVNTDSGNRDFEDRLKKFMQESDSRIADSIYADRPRRTSRRK